MQEHRVGPSLNGSGSADPAGDPATVEDPGSSDPGSLGAGPDGPADPVADEPGDNAPAEARDARLTRRRRWALVGVALTVYLLDQLTKQWALSSLDDGDRHIVGSLRLHLDFNTGSAFSVGTGRGALIGLLGIVMVGAMVWLARGVQGRVQVLAIGLVLGGAVGNLSDRLFREGSGFLGGAVVDFVDLRWWPVFNVADSAIVVGAILLALTWGRPAPGSAP